MRYVLRQRLWSLGGDFAVRDADGTDRFYVNAKVFTLSNEMVFEDAERRPVARVNRRLLAIGHAYDIWREEQLFATVREGWLPVVRYRFGVDVTPAGPGPEDVSITGDFWNHDYAFERAGRPIATVSRRWFSLADSFGVDVADDADAVLILACAVVVDLCTRKE